MVCEFWTQHWVSPKSTSSDLLKAAFKTDVAREQPRLNTWRQANQSLDLSASNHPPLSSLSRTALFTLMNFSHIFQAFLIAIHNLCSSLNPFHNFILSPYSYHQHRSWRHGIVDRNLHLENGGDPWECLQVLPPSSIPIQLTRVRFRAVRPASDLFSFQPRSSYTALGCGGKGDLGQRR